MKTTNAHLTREEKTLNAWISKVGAIPEGFDVYGEANCGGDEYITIRGVNYHKVPTIGKKYVIVAWTNTNGIVDIISK